MSKFLLNLTQKKRNKISRIYTRKTKKIRNFLNFFFEKLRSFAIKNILVIIITQAFSLFAKLSLAHCVSQFVSESGLVVSSLLILRLGRRERQQWSKSWRNARKRDLGLQQGVKSFNTNCSVENPKLLLLLLLCWAFLVSVVNPIWSFTVMSSSGGKMSWIAAAARSEKLRGFYCWFWLCVLRSCWRNFVWARWWFLFFIF